LLGKVVKLYKGAQQNRFAVVIKMRVTAYLPGSPPKIFDVSKKIVVHFTSSTVLPLSGDEPQALVGSRLSDVIMAGSFPAYVES